MRMVQALGRCLLKRVCQASPKQLAEQSIDLQGNTVKRLAKIVCETRDSRYGEVWANLSQLALVDKPEAREATPPASGASSRSCRPQARP